MPDFNQMQRQRLAAKNQAMPDGSFPIRNVADLKRAIQAYGRAKNKAAAKAWIIKRAKQLGREDLLPEKWRTSDTVTHYGLRSGGAMWVYNYGYYDAIMHHGIKGQKWGVRRYQNENGSLTAAGKSRYKSFSTGRYERKAAENKEKAAEHRRYAEDYNPKGYIGKSKYTDRQKARDQKKMNKELAIARKYEEKAQKMENRAKRSQEFDDKYSSELNKRSVGERVVKSWLVGALNYDSYIRQRAVGIDKGRAMVNTYLAGPFAGAKVRRDYINQDVKKDRANSKAMERADKQFNKAAWAYQNARKSRSKSEREQYERSGDRYRQKGVSELNKQNLTYNDIYGKNKVINTSMAKSDFDYKKEKYSHFRRW